MRRALLMTVFAALGAATLASAADFPIDQISVPVPREKEVRLDFPVGTLNVEAGGTDRVVLEVTGRCKGRHQGDCEERAEKIHVTSEEVRGVLRLSVEGYPKFNSDRLKLTGVLRIPASLALRIDMGVGELNVQDLEGDLDVDLGVGEADIRTSERAVRAVDVTAGVGDARVVASGQRVHHRSFISSSASWKGGRGASNVSVNVGVGEGTVRVD